MRLKRLSWTKKNAKWKYVRDIHNGCVCVCVFVTQLVCDADEFHILFYFSLFTFKK